MSLHSPLTALALLALLQGCVATAPQRPDAGAESALTERIALAQRDEAAGDVPRSLFHWQVAAALAPGDPRVADNIRRLRGLGDTQAQGYRDEAEGHLKRGRTRQAHEALLRVLALVPDDRQAMDRLRALEQGTLSRQMAAKVARSAKALYPHQEKQTKLSLQQAEAKVEKQFQRAEQSFKSQSYDSALKALEQAERAASGYAGLKQKVQYQRRKYADWLYGSGIRLADSDPDKALAYLRQTLRFEPQHAKAAVRIRRLNGE